MVRAPSQLLRKTALIVAAIAVAAPAVGAPTRPARNASGTVKVRTPLTLTRLSDLDFGTLLPSGQSGTAFINAYDGRRMVTGGVAAVAGDPGFRARFAFSGAPNQDIVIQLGPPPTLTAPSGASMRLLSLTLDGGPRRRIPASGTGNFGVGGALLVSANQREGAYSAAIDVTIDHL